MTTNQKRANKEVLVILNKFNMIDKIPKNVIESMKNNQDENWIFVYNDALKLEEQKLIRQSVILFTTLYYMYICDNKEEKENIKGIYKENDKKVEQNNDFEAFLKNVKKGNSIVKNENNLPAIKVKDDSLFTKIKKWIKSVLKK